MVCKQRDAEVSQIFLLSKKTTKSMFRSKQLKDYVGANDKTKVVVKLSTVGSGDDEQCWINS